eukprot:CAMPEP_0194279908 /NCGR_PEP_ID=MMETSP0169-20130528/14409_1 /TAXON_ID=218684 /ORGANISM="Corethron pennatum, Strain L29A3" /LENGTH=138 /DNA_ID=CAMNT_0039024397 /DNA_START=200 /DNA_END=616 /DNA_ORIENTATION=-
MGVSIPKEEKIVKEISMDEVAKHTSEDDVWMVIGNEKTGGPKVYNLTSYVYNHPGGAEILFDLAGQNADAFFEETGHSTGARKDLEQFLVGNLQVDEKKINQRKIEASTSRGISLMPIIALIIAAVIGYFLTQNEKLS